MERKEQEPIESGTEEKPGFAVFDMANSPIRFTPENDFYDEDSANRERKLISQSVDQSVGPVKQREIASPGDKTKWNDLNHKLINSIDLQTEIDDELHKVGSTPDDYSMLYLAGIFKMRLGVGLLTHVTLKNLQAISKRNKFEDKFVPYSSMVEYATSPEMSIRVGSIALPDFMTFERKTDDPSPYYQYLSEVGSYEEDSSQRIFEQNQDYPKNLYPNFTKEAILKMKDNLFATFTTNAKFENPQKRLLEIIKLSDRVVEGVQNVRDKCFQTVLNPDSKDFIDLSTLVQYNIESPIKNTRMYGLYLLGLDTRESIIEAYRKARTYEKEVNNGEFYMIFGDTISEYIEEVAHSANILTDEDIGTVLDSDKIKEDEKKDEPTLEQLGKIVNEITSNARQRDFDISVEDIDWSNLCIPDSAQIYFDPNRPRRFTIKVNFSNDLGESTEVECFLDTTRNVMDWNHREDPMALPDNPDLVAFRRSLLVAAQSILDNVYRRAQEEYQVRHTPQTNATTQERRPKRERYQDPVYQMRKEARTQMHESQPETDVFSEILSSRREVKNTVFLPSQEEFEDAARAFSRVDQEIVKNSIEEYNDKGTGAKFARKKGRGLGGEPMYGLSIGCTVPKGARVLLREIESEAGARNFEIIDIRYRKDIYSKNKL